MWKITPSENISHFEDNLSPVLKLAISGAT
jgi:hypothetical protein